MAVLAFKEKENVFVIIPEANNRKKIRADTQRYFVRFITGNTVLFRGNCRHSSERSNLISTRREINQDQIMSGGRTEMCKLGLSNS